MFKLQRMNIRDQTGRIQAGLLKKYFCLQKKTEKSFIWIGCALNGRFLTTLWLSDYFLMTAWHSLMAAWRLPDNCLMTAWRLPDDWMTTEWQLPDTCLTTAWRLPDDLLMTAWQLPVWWLPDTLVYQRWKYSSLPKFFTFDCQTTAWQLLDNCLTTAWRLPNDCLMTAWWLPEVCWDVFWNLKKSLTERFTRSNTTIMSSCCCVWQRTV